MLLAVLTYLLILLVFTYFASRPKVSDFLVICSSRPCLIPSSKKLVVAEMWHSSLENESTLVCFSSLSFSVLVMLWRTSILEHVWSTSNRSYSHKRVNSMFADTYTDDISPANNWETAEPVGAVAAPEAADGSGNAGSFWRKQVTIWDQHSSAS